MHETYFPKIDEKKRLTRKWPEMSAYTHQPTFWAD